MLPLARVSGCKSDMDFEVYSNAPIIEAALDVRVRTSEDVDLTSLRINDAAYPEESREPFQLQVKIEWGDKPKDSSKQHLNTPLGYFLRSADQKQILQARRDGFTFNRLAPYDRWITFGSEAKRLWTLYKSKIPVEQVEAVSLSYMNEILVPYREKVEDYLNAYIKLPEKLDVPLTAFSLGFQSVIEGDKGTLHIAQGIGPERREGYLTIGLFIQTIKFLGVSSALISDDELWAILEDLRTAKSKAFEACITDKVREMIR